MGVIGGVASAKSTPVAHPSTPAASAAPADPHAGNNPSPATPDQLQAGQTETLTQTADGTPVGTITVAKQAVTTYPADSYGEAPANGYYVIVKVTAAADQANHRRLVRLPAGLPRGRQRPALYRGQRPRL